MPKISVYLPSAGGTYVVIKRVARSGDTATTPCSCWRALLSCHRASGQAVPPGEPGIARPAQRRHLHRRRTGGGLVFYPQLHHLGLPGCTFAGQIRPLFTLLWIILSFCAGQVFRRCYCLLDHALHRMPRARPSSVPSIFQLLYPLAVARRHQRQPRHAQAETRTGT